MSEGKAIYKARGGFESPNYTQTPNDFFAMLPDMSDAELRVTIVMIRRTFGFHKSGFKLGIGKLATAAGLSPQGARDGARAAESRGTFYRTNPTEQGEAEWALVVPLNEVEAPLQPVEGDPQPSGGQAASKESIKKQKTKEVKEGQKPPTPPEVKLFRSVTSRFPNRVNYGDVVKSVGIVRERLGREVTCEDLVFFFKAWTAKGYKSINLAWLEWAETGQIPVNGTWKSTKYNDEPKAFEAIRQWQEMVTNG